MNKSVTSRNPWLAAILSMLLTGLGHLYCGRMVKGLSLLFVNLLLFAHFLIDAAFMESSTMVLCLLLGSVAVILVLYIYAVIDAYRLAKRVGENYELKEYNHPLFYAVFLVIGLIDHVGVPLLVRANLFEAFYIPTASEAPNILPGDRVLVNKLAYRNGGSPQRGETVVFRNPEDANLRWVKRVIAIEGDTIELRDNQVFVNGDKLVRQPASKEQTLFAEGNVYTEESSGRSYTVQLQKEKNEEIADFAKTTVPRGCCFVLGDNRDRSRDSRQIGFVPLGNIIGTVQYVYWPAKSWSRFGKL